MVGHGVSWIAALAAFAALSSAAPAPPPVPTLPTRCDESVAVPEFGGAYVERGTLHVWLTTVGDDQGPAATQVAQTLARACPDQYSSFGPSVTLHRADYTFAELAAWEGSVRSLLSQPDVVMTDVNEQTNRLTVGVASFSDGRAAEIIGVVSALGVPAAAVEVVPASPVTAEPPRSGRRPTRLGRRAGRAGCRHRRRAARGEAPATDRWFRTAGSALDGALGEAGDEAVEEQVEDQGDRDGDQHGGRLQRLPEEHVAADQLGRVRRC